MPISTLRGHSDFTRLWFGQTVSNFGDKVSRLALPTIAILTLHGTALNVGILGALRFLPFLLLGPIVGVLADRIPRRTLMIVADLGRLVATALVQLAFATDMLSMPLLYALAAVTGGLTVLFEVSYQSYLPALVGRDALVEGNQKLQVGRSVADVAGASIGGVLMQALGSAVAVLVDSLSFAVSLVGLVLIKHREAVPDRRTDSRPSAVAEARDGLRALVGDSRLRALMLSTATVNLGVATAGALVLVYSYGRGGLHPGEVGAAFAVGTVGLILGALVASRLTAVVPPGRLIMLAVAVTGSSYPLLLAFRADHALVGLIVVQFLIGFADMVYNIHVMSLVQAFTPDDVMGRVGGTALTVVWGSGTFGSLLGGVVGAGFGVVPGLCVAGAIVLAGALILFFSPIRSMR